MYFATLLNINLIKAFQQNYLLSKLSNQLMLVYLFGGKVEVRTTKLMSQTYISALWPIPRLLLFLNIYAIATAMVVNKVWS